MWPEEVLPAKKLWQVGFGPSGSDAFTSSLKGTQMPLGTLSIRVNEQNPRHHLYRNGRLWWAHLTVHHSGFKKRRIRRSLGTASLDEAICRRDSLLEAIRAEGLGVDGRACRLKGGAA
jgi:hypothetical protein